MMDTSQFCCPNEKCPDYGKRGKGNIICNRCYGKQRTQLLKCKTCEKSFSENRGTPFFNLRTPKEKVVDALKVLVERGSLRGTARATGHKKDTIAFWQGRAGEHADALRAYLLHELHLDRVEVDELYTFEKKEKNVRGNEPDLETIGENLIWRALKPETKLRLASHVGKDSAQEAEILIGKIKQVSDGQSPFFASDGRSYRESLTKHYSTEVQPDPSKPKRGRPRKQPERRRNPDLLYGQAIKDKDSRGRVVSVRRRMVFGSVAALRKRFEQMPLNQLLTTNRIERDHLTSRTHNSRLVRRSITYSKAQAPLQWQCDFEDLYYNFCLPHSSLRRELLEPIPTKGSGSPKKWKQVTPAMAEGIADHIMTLPRCFPFPSCPNVIITLEGHNRFVALDGGPVFVLDGVADVIAQNEEVDVAVTHAGQVGFDNGLAGGGDLAGGGEGAEGDGAEGGAEGEGGYGGVVEGGRGGRTRIARMSGLREPLPDGRGSFYGLRGGCWGGRMGGRLGIGY